MGASFAVSQYRMCVERCESKSVDLFDNRRRELVGQCRQEV
jgi:hypothetical protein